MSSIVMGSSGCDGADEGFGKGSRRRRRRRMVVDFPLFLVLVSSTWPRMEGELEEGA